MSPTFSTLCFASCASIFGRSCTTLAPWKQTLKPHQLIKIVDLAPILLAKLPAHLICRILAFGFVRHFPCYKVQYHPRNV